MNCNLVYIIESTLTKVTNDLVNVKSMWNAELDEAQAGIKTARRYINNLRYADDTTLMAESEELKSLLQHHNSKAPILQHSAFFAVQLSHPYMTTKKNHSFD